MGRPLVLGRSQLSGKQENLGTDSGKNIDLELMFVELMFVWVILSILSCPLLL